MKNGGAKAAVWTGGLVFLLSVCGPAVPPSMAYDDIALAATLTFKKVVARPGGAAALPSGGWIVSDESAGILQVFSSDGKPKGSWGAKGKAAGQLGTPRGLAADSDGNVYVADAGLHRVAVFTPEGKFLRAIGSKGSGAGQLDGPSGVAVTSDGVLYVADTGNHRIQAFSRDGVFLFGFGGPGEGDGRFKAPSAVVADPRARLHVMDERRVQTFTTEGTFIAALARPKSRPADKEPPPSTGLAGDDSGALYVANAAQRIEEYGPDGKFIASFGTYGTGAGQFKTLTGLASGRGGLVLALDGGVDRAQAFTVVEGMRTALVPAPTLRFSVKTLETHPFLADDIAFSGQTLAGVSAKSNQVLVAGGRGAEPIRAFPAKVPPAKAAPRGRGPGQLDGPAALCAAGDRLWIADAGNTRIVAWGVDGSSPTQTPVGSRGNREGQFKSPAAVAVDARGRILVADSATKRVQLFSPDGLYLRSLPGPFLSPVDVASLPSGPVVLDAGAKTVSFFDDKGRLSGESSSALVNPVALAADPKGRLGFAYVLDAGDGQVKVLNGSRLVARFGAPSLFREPKAIALDDRGAVWVADADGVKAFEIRLSPLAPASFTAKPGEGRIELSWKTDPEKMAESFRLYRSTLSPSALPSTGDTGLWREIRSSSTDISSDRYTAFDDEIVPGLTYTYTISAVSGGLSPLEGARAEAKCSTTRPVNLPPVDLVSLDLDKVFSAQYKYYEKNAVGRAVIKNNTEKSFQKVRVGFIMQNYMDFVTEKVLDRLEPGARETVELKATFNNKILSVTEDTPIQAQLTITYYDNGEEKVFKRAEPMTLFARNAMSWDDPRRLSTFITPKDPAALEFARASVRDFRKEIEAAPVNPALAKAAIVFEALGARGLSYLKDPNGPFDASSERPKTVDYVQYPRETLKRKTGDCDDLTALTAALMESVGVPTAFLDIPGHVLLAVQLDDAFPLDPGLPDGSVLLRDGARWIPVETTVVGQPFLDAWDQGVKTVRNVPEERLSLIETQDAWDSYPPATLPEEPGVEAPRKADVTDKFPGGGVKALASRRLNTLTARFQAALKANPDDRDARLQLGLVRAESGLLEQSAKDFDVLLATDPLNAAALNDRGNLYWIAGNAAKARELYDRAAQADPKDAGVRINLARAAMKTGDAAAAKEALKEALALDPSLKKDYSSPEDLQ